ncbi:MAG: hypothetical protein C0498_14385 [Anaerolinea sp.]|nr:hypothetical protein [Anaerolinea sp.]
MSRPRLALAGGLALALAGCGSTVDRGASATPAAPAPAATAVPAAPSPAVRIWGAGAAVSYPYGSFAEWVRDAARMSRGIALVRIVEVSGVRWSTATGEKPSPADIVRADQTGASIYLGRLVTVELVRMLRGAWPAAGATALYWRSGGQIGNDRTPDYAAEAGLPELRAGSLAVADMIPAVNLDEATDGVLWVNVNVLFPVDDVGRVRTAWPTETIMIGEIDRYLPAP